MMIGIIIIQVLNQLQIDMKHCTSILRLSAVQHIEVGYNLKDCQLKLS